jgi:hypothetical protein
MHDSLISKECGGHLSVNILLEEIFLPLFLHIEAVAPFIGIQTSYLGYLARANQITLCVIEPHYWTHLSVDGFNVLGQSTRRTVETATPIAEEAYDCI